MESSGLHSNGYSLVRHVLARLADRGGAGWSLDPCRRARPHLGEGCSGADRIYAKACLALADRTQTHAMSTSPAAGLAANLEQVLPGRADRPARPVHLDPQPVFDLVRQVGPVPQPDLEMTLNCGSAWSPSPLPRTPTPRSPVLAEHGVRAWVAGDGPGRRLTRRRAGRPGGLVGQHPAGEFRRPPDRWT